MKVTVNRQEFADAVSWVAKAMPSRPTNPVLSSLRVTADDADTVTVLGGGYEVTHKATLRAVIDEPGVAIVPGAVTRDLASALPGTEAELAFDPDKVGAVLRAGRSTYRLPTIDEHEWPTMLVFPTAVCQVDGTEFRSLVRTVKAFTDQTGSFDAISGVRIEAAGGELRTVATNRFVISTAATPVDGDVNFGVLIPARNFDAALAGMTGTVTVGHDGATFGVRDDTREVVLRVIDAEFPTWRNLLRPDDTFTFTAPTGELVEAVKRASIAAQKDAPIWFTVTEGEVEITVGVRGNPDGAEVVEVDGGEKFDIAFSPTLLAAILATIPGDRVQFGFGTTNRQLVNITDPDDDAAQHALMPRNPTKA